MVENISNISSNPHYPVMLKEVIDNLIVKKDGNYLDCTFGAGGYSSAILENCEGKLYSIDQDPNVLIYAQKLQKQYNDRFNFLNINFSDCCDKLGHIIFDGIVLDLGVSSMQLDEAKRGFSFSKDGPLDMRMSGEGISASDVVNNYDEKDIADIIYKYGEEVQSRNIAKNIVKYRNISEINNSLQLAEIVREAMHFRKSKIDPATKTFQALRIYINKELEVLEKFLEFSKSLLAPKGRLVIVSFHSLEDSIVKNFIKKNGLKNIARSKYSKAENLQQDGKWLKIITKKPIAPSREEILENHRSRSAKLRVAEKIEEVILN